MAHELGFSEYSIAQMAESLYDQKILQSTWDCVKVLDGHVRSCKSLPCTVDRARPHRASRLPLLITRGSAFTFFSHLSAHATLQPVLATNMFM